MPSNTIPLSVPDDLLNEVRETADQTQLSQADVMRQSMKLGLPRLREQLAVERGVKPFTRGEARRAFAPDAEWDKLESALARRSHQRPEPD